jgi:hypothetical protein
MSQIIRVSESVMGRLKSLAEPFVDSPCDVIEKLLEIHDQHHEKNGGRRSRVFHAEGMDDQKASSLKSKMNGSDKISKREQRERGGIVAINGKKFEAVSVADLYRKTMQYLCDEGFMEKIQRNLPIPNGSIRYILAREPSHKNGDPFHQPANYGEYYMEAHWSWADGVKYLQKMLKPYDLDVEYVGPKGFR